MSYEIKGNEKFGYTVVVKYNDKTTQIGFDKMDNAQEFVIKLMVNMGEIGC